MTSKILQIRGRVKSGVGAGLGLARTLSKDNVIHALGFKLHDFLLKRQTNSDVRVRQTKC